MAMRHPFSPAGLLLALTLPSTAAMAADDLAALRAEMQALRASYEARLQALEARLQAAERGAPTAAAPATPTAAPAPAATAPSGPGMRGAASGNANSFNPALSLILSGLYTRTSRDPEDYRITGFARPEDAEIGPGTRGLSLAETELGFAANIDPWWRGAASIALTPDNEVEVEEAYVQTTALGRGSR
jgi:hypothetical protein